MRVHIAPCGMGLGHIGRCLPLAHELIERGFEVQISTYGEALEYARVSEFSVKEAPRLWFSTKPDGSADVKQSLVSPGLLAIPIFAKQVVREIELIQSFEPDVVVSDSRASTIVAAKALRKPVLTILNQFYILVPIRRFRNLYKLMNGSSRTVLGWFWRMSDAIAVPDLPPPYTVSWYNLQVPKWAEHKTRFVGPMVPIKPEDLLQRGDIRKRLGVDQGEILLYASVSGQRSERVFLLSKLERALEALGEEFRAILSKGDPASEEVSERGRVMARGWLSERERFELMKACDVVVSRSGHGTITQSILYSRPMVLIPTPNHTEQLNNAKRARELGVAVVLPQHRLSAESLRRSVYQALELARSSRLEKLSKLCRDLGGVDSVAEIAHSLAS